jgi:signal transduction histidine kinase
MIGLTRLSALNSLRFSFLLAMLAVATVAIVTIALFSGLTTHSEFSRYVQMGREIREMQLQEAVLTYWKQDKQQEFAEAITEPGVNAQLSASSEDSVDMIVFNTEQYGVVSLDLPTAVNLKAMPGDDAHAVNFVRSGDSMLEVREGDQSVGVLQLNPAVDTALAPAQNEFVASVSWGLLAASGIAAVMAVSLTLILSRRVLHPVLALTDAARKMESGDLSQRVTTRGKGEIGDLANAFNSMAETLQHNELLRRNMVGDIAHELRTPLTNIRGYLEALQDGVLSSDSSVIELIHDEAMLLNGLIQDLQELALAEARQLHIERQAMAVQEVIEQTISMLQPSANAAQLTLSADVAPDLPPVYADPRRVGQILRNLISNAIKHTPHGGQICVAAATTPNLNAIEVRVTDSGRGIEDEHLPYIFERFYRVDPSRSRHSGGAGLGLAICKQLIETLGGHIQVESAVGQGTTFAFTLPLYRPAR